MTCGYCQFGNTQDDHRCRRCGRRLMGTATPAPAYLAQEHTRLAVQAMGANALAAVQVTQPSVETPRVAAGRTEARVPRVAARRDNEIPMDAAATLDSVPRSRVQRPVQPSLFGAELQPKIIPFETIYRPAVEEAAVTEAPVKERAKAPAKTGVKNAPRRAPVDDSQATLDFLPPLKNTPRTMKTNAEAVIFCEATVASPIHRATAAALDLSMITMGFGSVLFLFQGVAHPAVLSRTAMLGLVAMLGVVALFYGLVFAIAGTVTPGMKWTHLRLINFDGFPLDGRARAVRFIGSWISVLSGGLGILWSLLDEEHLSWHDHMSKTFPTLRESESIVVRQRKR